MELYGANFDKRPFTSEKTYCGLDLGEYDLSPTLLPPNRPNISQLTKALLVRAHPSVNRFTDKLFDLFGQSEVGWDAARAIGEAVKKDQILTKANHAVVRVRTLKTSFWRITLMNP